MNILKRIDNAYKGGGFKELYRKVLFHSIYRVNNYVTRYKVKHSKIQGLYTGLPRKRKLIVSLTSFPSRFNHIDLCIRSLLQQKVKPDRVIIYLGSDTSRQQLTKEMLQLEKYGVEYRFDATMNLKAHKKYFYAMQEFAEDLIVTADDDLYYPSNWLETLYEGYKKYPHAVIARRVHLMKKDGENLARYNLWVDQCRTITTPSFSLFATGGSGKLYPPHCLPQETFDTESIKKYALNADDVWLKCMEIINKVPVVWVKNYEVDQISVEKKQAYALAEQNVDLCLNDKIIRDLMEKYNIEPEAFFEK